MASALSNRQNCACARKTLQTQRGWTHGAGCGCGNGSVPLSHSGNVVTRIGIHTHTHIHDAITANLIGRTHPYRGYGCVPLRFGGASFGEWEHNKNDAITRCQTWISITHMVACAELQYKKSNFMPVIIHLP